MKLKALALALFVAGACTSFALADDGHGKGKNDAAATTATTGSTTAAQPADQDDQDGQGEQAGKNGKAKGKDKAHGAKKVTLCHQAGHSGRWVKISVSTHAAKARGHHGDVAPDASGNCPAPTAPTTTDSTTTESTTTDTTTTATTTTNP